MMTVALTLVFGLLQLVGGVMCGASARQLVVAFTGGESETRSAGIRQAGGTLVFGAILGGAGTLESLFYTLPVNRWYFLGGLLLFVAAVLGSALLPRFILQEIGAGTFVGIGLGLIIVPMGVLVGIEAIRNDELWFGLFWGGCAGFVGLTFLLGGLQALLSGKALALRQKAPGNFEIVPQEDMEKDETPLTSETNDRTTGGQ